MAKNFQVSHYYSMRLISLIKSQAVDKTLIKYFIVGAISFICDLAIFGFFLKVLDFYYLFSATLSFVFATSLNFYLSKNFAFNGLQKFSSIRTFGLIFLASSVGLLINMSFLYIFYESGPLCRAWHYTVAFY